MDGNECRRMAAILGIAERGVNRTVVRQEEFDLTLSPTLLVDSGVSGDLPVITHHRHGILSAWIAVAVNHQPRVAARDQGRPEPGCQADRHESCTDIPGDVKIQIFCRHS